MRFWDTVCNNSLQIVQNAVKCVYLETVIKWHPFLNIRARKRCDTQFRIFCVLMKQDIMHTDNAVQNNLLSS
jgi:hypothetical protein